MKYVDINDKKLDTIKYVKVNYQPPVDKNLTPKVYVDNAISHSVCESSILGLDIDEKLKLDEQD